MGIVAATSLEELIRASVVDGGPVNPESTAAFVRGLVTNWSGDTRFKVLEVGGGRTPLFSPDECEDLGIDYWVNDISAEELSFLPDSYHAAEFNVAGSPRHLPQERFDLVFSRSVLEHVEDSTQAIANSFDLLNPGGVMLHSFPTLYNPAYVVNRLIPERLSKAVLRRVVGYTYEKFPARYNKTTSGESQLTRLAQVGFTEGAVVPYWGHGYLHFAPALARAESKFANMAQRKDWRWYSTFAFLVGRR